MSMSGALGKAQDSGFSWSWQQNFKTCQDLKTVAICPAYSPAVKHLHYEPSSPNVEKLLIIIIPLQSSTTFLETIISNITNGLHW